MYVCYNLDPKILEDVQRALKAKALRESRSRTDATASVSRTSVAELSGGGANEDARSLAKAITVPFPVTPPKPVISISTHSSPLHPAAPPKIVFPSYTHSPAHSLESISSFGHLIRSPIPVRVTSQEGVTWLDWSGAPPEPVTSEKEKTLLGRTFSLTKRKSKAKGRIASLAGRNSLDFRASQGELYAGESTIWFDIVRLLSYELPSLKSHVLTTSYSASLDSIRRAARRDTLSRAEMTKDELGRRYAFLTSHKPTSEPGLDILDVVKSRQDHTKIHTPWLAWCRLLLLSQQKTNEWILTADSIDEYLQRSGRRPTRPPLISPSTPINVSAKRPHSPGFGFSSPLSSPHSSLSTSPLANGGARRRDRKSLELSRSLSANPIVEGMAASPSLSRTMSRSLSLTRATSTGSFTTSLVENRRSADVVRPENSSYTNLNTSPRSSLDRGSDSQLLSKVVNSENHEKKKHHASLPAEKAKLSLESRTSTVSSVPNLLGTAQPHGVTTAGRLHLGVGKMFGRKRTNGDEVAGENIVHSRSSVSDERDSAREGEGTKSDDGGRLKAGMTLGTPGLDLRGFMTRGKEVLSTSDSETNGLLSVKLGKRLRRIDRDHDKDRVAEDVAMDIARDSLSGGEQWQVDALAAPGWTTTRGVRRARTSAPKEIGREKLQELLQKREEDEERENEIYQAREQLLIEANDHNRRIARLLKIICVSIRDHENDQSELAQALGFAYQPIPAVVLDAVSADPATSLRHGKGYQAVEDSYQRSNCRHSLLRSYLETLRTTPEHAVPCDMSGLIEEAERLWQRLQVKSKEIEEQAKLVIPALQRAVEHMAAIQKEYNITQMIAETDYSEVSYLCLWW